jgi:hypothetical protein
MCLTPRSNNNTTLDHTDVEHFVHYMLGQYPSCLMRGDTPSDSPSKTVRHPLSGLEITFELCPDDDFLYCNITGGYGFTPSAGPQPIIVKLANGTLVPGAIAIDASGLRTQRFKFPPTRAGESALLLLACEALERTATSHWVRVLECAFGC